MSKVPVLPKTPLAAGDKSAKELAQEKFRHCLRDADVFIKEHKFAQARIRLEDAKKLDSTNSYIKAFEERILTFEKNTDQVGGFFPKPSPVALKKIEDQPLASITLGGNVAVSQELLEQHLRRQIEGEFKIKYMEGLRQAEEHAAQELQKEQETFEIQSRGLKAQHEQQLAEFKRKTEEEYRVQLTSEIAATEQRLKQQFQLEQGLIEQQMKSRLNEQYEAELSQMRERLERDQVELLEKERRSFQKREHIMKEQFDLQLQEAFRAQGLELDSTKRQEHELEQQKLRQRLEAEFQSGLLKVRDSFKKNYEGIKSKLEQSFSFEQSRAKDKYTRQTNEQLELLRQHEHQEFERKRDAVVQDVEADVKNKYQAQLAAERKRIQAEADVALDATKKKNEEDQKTFITAQNEKIRKMRSDIKYEMEHTFLRRLEQISKQYEQKMELFGVRTPQSQEEAVDLYREKMREIYAQGEPTVEGAKKIMELKEMLSITFDNHFIMESEVRLELFTRQAERLIANGEAVRGNIHAFDELKERFKVGSDQIAQVQSYLDSCFHRFACKGTILVVDDDPLLLKQVKDNLVDRGYEVLSSDRIDAAIEKLKETSVDVILSDIKFPDGEPDGFHFLAVDQEQPHLRKLPFIFMSALNDGAVMRSGVQLGVDDYLTKPLDLDLLVAVIEGKLKRYRTFNTN